MTSPSRWAPQSLLTTLTRVRQKHPLLKIPFQTYSSKTPPPLPSPDLHRPFQMDVAQYFLDGNADAVEFCPHHLFHHVLAAATYTLQEGVQPNRSGSISLFSVDVDAGLELLHRIETAGVFDIKWNQGQANTHPLLAQADADGFLRLHRFGYSSDVPESRGAILGEVGVEKVDSSMCLCLDWNPSSTSLAVGLSSGSVSIVALKEAQLQIWQSWKAHDFELWTTSFDTHQPQLLYTGSDDCRFSCWDLRESHTVSVFQNTKTHKMGVCCIAKSPMDSNALLTGSYDEFLRVWDVRSTSKPINETSICLGGGVWRIKHHPNMPGLVLAACMHNGFAVARIESGNVEVVETYGKHESLAYGADWQHGGLCMEDGKEKGTIVATCSFYDRLLRIWMPESQTAK
ncbi:uncharacterized protein LOC131234831 [Magnolia sinica]|uniref:uncharacterized protein LOC131234831 n=1 Tax=Magnolia sinica TaxID=86752 RepID=UPI00265A090A|nr:uncharacterized protein LOC131234831 [Magnolia sinica]